MKNKGKAAAWVMSILAVVMVFLTISSEALAAPKKMKDGTIFDPVYYAQMNPDVVAALGTKESALYNHYKKYGKAEGRLPYDPNIQLTADVLGVSTVTLKDGTVFDPVYYAQMNPDVVMVLGSKTKALSDHYLKYGKAEGRMPSAEMAALYALMMGQDLQQTQPTASATPAPATAAQAQVQQPEQPATQPAVQTAHYVLNTSTMKFHRPGCSHLKKMNAANRMEVDDSRDAIIAAGYSACKTCNP